MLTALYKNNRKGSTRVQIVSANGKERTVQAYALSAWHDTGWNGAAVRSLSFDDLSDIRLDGALVSEYIPNQEEGADNSASGQWREHGYH